MRRSVEDEHSSSNPRPVRCLIPHEIVHIIFLLLPARTVFRFRFVCKSWLKSISDPAFIAAHAVTSPTTYLLFFSSRLPGYYLFDHQSGSYRPVLLTKLVPGCDNNKPPKTIILVANGLLMFYYSKAIHICNPCTREIAVLPVIVEEPVVANRCKRYPSVGFGVDPSSGKYKVVRLSYEGNASQSCRCIIFVQGGPRCWRRVACPSVRLYSLEPIFLNGVLYWITSMSDWNEEYGILSFNLCHEKFAPIPAPPRFGWSRHRLEGLQGCLCYVCCDPAEKGVDIWMLKESDDGSTNFEWRKTYNIKIDIPRTRSYRWYTRVIAMQTGQLLIVTPIGLYSYNLKREDLSQVISWHEETNWGYYSSVRDAYTKGSLFTETLAYVS